MRNVVGSRAEKKKKLFSLVQKAQRCIVNVRYRIVFIMTILKYKKVLKK